MHQSPVAQRDTGESNPFTQGILKWHFTRKKLQASPSREQCGFFFPGVQVREAPLKERYLKDRKGPLVVSHFTALSISLVTGVWVRIWSLAAHRVVTGIQIGCWWGGAPHQKATHAYLEACTATHQPGGGSLIRHNGVPHLMVGSIPVEANRLKNACTETVFPPLYPPAFFPSSPPPSI